MTILTPAAPRLWILGLALSLIGTGAGTHAGAGQVSRGTPSMEWTGTVTVELKANGALPGPASVIKFKGLGTTTYTLRGDGTALWTSTLSSSTDLGGRYSIPLVGSGSGTGTAGVSFNGQGWDIGVQADGDFPTEEDHTDEDRVMAKDGPVRILVELAKAMGEPYNIEPRVEKGRGSPLEGQAVSRGAANATTLSGSISQPAESQPIGGGSGILATLTVSWNLTKTPVPPHVNIYGPECGCMDADETEKTLHFTAGAAPTGGEFSEFIVTSDGKMPAIVNNTGGAQPSLDITGDKDTGAVTLKIRYTRNGTRLDSAPFVVNFCRIDEIKLADDEHDIAFGSFDRLQVNAKSRAWRGGKDVSSELEWDIDKMSAPTSIEAQPSTRKGPEMRFQYNDLPEKNTAFGKKKLTAKLTGKCACQREETIRAFFDPDEKNNPEGKSPNWFYYWLQAPSVPGDARAIAGYRETLIDPNTPGVAAARYDPETQRLYLARVLHTDKGCRPRLDKVTRNENGEHAKGIDCFMEDVLHEMQHRRDFIEWWGSPAGPVSAGMGVVWLDPDLDNVPTGVELLHGCNPLYSFSCSERPFKDTTDAEINAYWVGWAWRLGTVNSQDWSCGPLAKQWQGKKCGQ